MDKRLPEVNERLTDADQMEVATTTAVGSSISVCVATAARANHKKYAEHRKRKRYVLNSDKSWLWEPSHVRASREERAAEAERAERDWQQRVREGRFVLLALKPSRVPLELDAVTGDHGICARICRGGRPRNDGTVSGVAVGPNTGWVPRARGATCVR